MTLNNNISVLPFYTDKALQHHNKSYAYGQIYPLYAPANYLLPFQIIRTTRTNSIVSMILYDKLGNRVTGMTEMAMDAGLEIVKFDDYDIIVYPATLPLAINQTDGMYYIRISDGVDVWFSEIFTAVQDITPYLKIEWWDEQDFEMTGGRILYKNPAFRNVVYLNTDVGKPDYEFEEAGEDRDGYFFAEKQVSSKKYKFTFVAPEFLCDVMRLIRMADHIRITDKFNRQYVCDSFLMTPKWQTQGDLASVEVEFTADTVAKKLGVGYLISQRGDYGNDYNSDYNNE